MRESEEQVERNRGTHHGYKSTATTEVPVLKGLDRNDVFESVIYRDDVITGQRVRRYDVGFIQDGLVASNLSTWRGKIMAEFFIEVILDIYFVNHYFFNSTFYARLALCFVTRHLLLASWSLATMSLCTITLWVVCSSLLCSILIKLSWTSVFPAWLTQLKIDQRSFSSLLGCWTRVFKCCKLFGVYLLRISFRAISLRLHMHTSR